MLQGMPTSNQNQMNGFEELYDIQSEQLKLNLTKRTKYFTKEMIVIVGEVWVLLYVWMGKWPLLNMAQD